ncbi:WecB/TagA/CpsF family glycosyltransferase [Herbivorax sp. ANBcel31]|uniref:WecB/TagA/CpsF family glycosyltransferase n=1 Tax=Herbivorax sp. ANBcel31 TaxID=3069754 RepID=UPI0027B70A99|nr:WecB/TagA/CpsF family glycosyltransferase [Herbivorax sp. ANBcel31]MDQ2085609.1 WecB/TagA/CpsF family glycosyltransferase [Herbivorax sp. ANBcel31]
MRTTVDILGVPVDNVTMNEALDIVENLLNGDRSHSVFTPNAEIMMAAQRDSHFKKILRSADLVVPDGAGVVLASKILKPVLKDRVAGFDLTCNLFKKFSNKDARFFFLGGKPGVAKEAHQKLLDKNININVVGIRDGYFSESEEDKIINQINSSKADILLVALGAPKQEKWIYKHLKQIDARVCIGVGGTFDGIAGKMKRAPKFFQNHGLEWLYRLFKDPKRFFRMLDIPKFIFLVVAKKIKLCIQSIYKN